MRTSRGEGVLPQSPISKSKPLGTCPSPAQTCLLSQPSPHTNRSYCNFYEPRLLPNAGHSCSPDSLLSPLSHP